VKNFPSSSHVFTENLTGIGNVDSGKDWFLLLSMDYNIVGLVANKRFA